MNFRISLVTRFVLLVGATILATSCSTGVFFADDNQEGHVGFVSATQYRDVADVLIVKKGTAPKLTGAIEPKVQEIPRIAEPVPATEIAKTDTLLKNETAFAKAAPRYDIPILEAKKQPVVQASFISPPR